MCPFQIMRRIFYEAFQLIALSKTCWSPQGKFSFPLTELITRPWALVNQEATPEMLLVFEDDNLPLPLTSPCHSPAQGFVVPQESMLILTGGALWCSHTRPCMLCVPILGSRQDSSCQTEEGAETQRAGRSCSALYSPKKAELRPSSALTLCLRHSSSSLLTSFSSP